MATYRSRSHERIGIYTSPRLQARSEHHNFTGNNWNNYQARDFSHYGKRDLSTPKRDTTYQYQQRTRSHEHIGITEETKDTYMVNAPNG